MFWKKKDIKPPITGEHLIRWIDQNGSTLYTINLRNCWSVPPIPGVGTIIKTEKYTGIVTKVVMDYTTEKLMFGDAAVITVNVDEIQPKD